MRCAAVVLAGMALAGPSLAAEPVLDRITLSSSGVGEFEFTAPIGNGEPVALDVPLHQVDDVLKSLLVDDPAGPPSVRLPGREELSESFRTLPFGPEALASPDALLRTLVGEAVRLPGQGIAGTILSVNDFETVLPNNGGTQVRHRLTVATAEGIETVVLEEVQGGIAFSSETLRRQIGAALAAIAARRVQDRRTLRLDFAEGAPRTVRFGYVVPVPVWKASYRLEVPAEGSAAPIRLKAFAVVENLSGRDWKGVQVVLTSGDPVLYHQPLYEAVYASRPEAPVEVANRLTPGVDEGSVPMAPMRSASEAVPASQMRMAAPAPMASQMVGAAAPVPPPGGVGPGRTLVDARQSIAQVAFTLAEKVTAASGESLLLPIIDRDVPARRVAYYQAGAETGAEAAHPLVAVLLKNDGTGALPPGLATLYERGGDAGEGFIGDARLPGIQPGEERLASFAADLAVRVEARQGSDTAIVSGRAAGGVLTVSRRDRNTTTYRVTTPASTGRSLVLDSPKRVGWTLVEPAGAGSTPSAYRIERELKAGATTEIKVVLEHPRSERVVLSESAVTALLALSTEGSLSQDLRGSLQRAADLRLEFDRRSEVLRGLVARREAIVADQERIRSNLGAVPANSELQRRYLGQLQQQENDLAGLDKAIEAARGAAREAERAWRGFVASLNVVG